VLTIGSFDGFHIGHQKIIEKVVAASKSLGCESLVLTFFPHPKMVLTENSDIKSLNTIDEKIILLQYAGLQNLVIQEFDKKFSELSPEDFVKQILVDKLNIQKIIIGHDHRFGKNRSANIDDLILFGVKYNFEVEQISAQEINEVAVSSTKIRTAILDGNIELANQYLGYNYSLSGTIVKGKQLGRTIGFPTANLKIEEGYKLIPKIGVYVVQSQISNETVFGIMNIGNRPTVDGKSLTIEVHFLDFDGNLYDKNLNISILTRIRDEQKFESVEILKNQLEKDREFAVLYLGKITILPKNH
jgi:riboflavin kinase / FMN adenylyltransferase